MLAEPFPRIRSHIRSVLSFPTLRATFPEGCTATQLTRPLWPFKLRKTFQSRAWKRQSVPSSDAESRCDRDGNPRYVMEPTEGSAYIYGHGLRKLWVRQTFMMHKSTNLLPSPQIPNLHNFVSAARSQPLPTIWRCSNDFDA